LDTARGALNDLEIGSLLCAPLLDGDGNAFGVVQIDTDQLLRGFTSDGLEVMVAATIPMDRAAQSENGPARPRAAPDGP
jgi:hypothetical protein